MKNSVKNFFEAENYITQVIDNKLKEDKETKEVWNLKAANYKKLKAKLHLSEEELSKGRLKLIEIIKIVTLTIILFPLGIYGLISNGWFFYLSNFAVRYKFKDKTFYSTFSFAINFLLYPFWFLAHLIIIYSIFDSWIIALGLVLFSFPSGIIAWELGQLIKRTIRRLKIGRMISAKNKQYSQLNSVRNELIGFYKSIFD